MSTQASAATLDDRALIILGGPDWRSFLQGLVTQDVETLKDGEARFSALLTPQGRLLYDLFLVGCGDDCLVDCAAAVRETLIRRLTMYRLRAKVTIEAAEMPVRALWGAAAAPEGWAVDPRLPGLGWRGYGLEPPVDAAPADAADYAAHVLACGAPGPADWGVEQTYPVEANFDLLGGIDFRKGCFVGQETTSRMKRRGTVKSRMAPVTFEGPAPEPGSELLNGTLRAGEVLSGVDGRAMASVRLDRLQGDLTLADGRPARVDFPGWLQAALAPADPG
ncbi:YgfZ/GcvT domain-containing protein [Caulobacter sp. KR2-114]|uniref:CAF17-like 4Fe-4S cluster assembly/insertion protein YgfZ n=1 Tax=Caulobacter sp. KR2-114 TaxID=3400912 RepID=UPI003BFCBD6C